ncbi:hypothetical protein [Streptomyces cylindrosporus]|uniref:Uncharacterized protein n=1 Tax=Streptomyces cylindrosporus TaxID=2927583 RepID=A0ABS9YM84_9ACTN|nr:hypothetical protein [Streptomyces cylindrosporus]MCI3277661.1 hypothetical protein [Streptomyces cylindrosporus]
MPRTVPSIAAEVPGNFVTSALWTAQVGAIMQWLVGSGSNGLPMFFGYQATSQSVASGTTGAAITIDTEVIDTDGGHSTVTNTSRYTCQVAGYYLLWGSTAWAINATEERITYYQKNGTTIPGGSSVQIQSVSSGHATVVVGTLMIVPLAVGDYVEVWGSQVSGGALSTQADVAAGKNCSMLVMWLHA